MIFQTVGLDDLAERCRVDEEQLWPQHQTMGNTELKTTGWRARVLDSDRLSPILKVGLEPTQSCTSDTRDVRESPQQHLTVCGLEMLPIGPASPEAQRVADPLPAECRCALE